MSDPESPRGKKPGKPLTAKQKLKNLLRSLLDPEPGEKIRLTAKERAWLEGMRQTIDESQMSEPDAVRILAQNEERFSTICGRGVTKRDMDRLRETLKRTLEEHEARLDWEAGAEWTGKAAKRKPPGSGHLM